MTKCPDDFGDPCPGTNDPECRDCVFLMARKNRVDDKITVRILNALGTGGKATWRSPRECAVIMHGLNFTADQLNVIDSILSVMERRGVLEKKKMFSHYEKQEAFKYKRKGSHPR